MKIDKVLHFAFCCACAIIVSTFIAHFCTSPTPAILAGFFAGTALGIGKEFGDYRAEDNTWSNNDLLFDIAGAVVGSLGGFVQLLI